jgi:hypothetical protein
MADVAVVETLPKDLLQFVEHNEGRALEVLREIIEAPDWDNAPNQAMAAQAVTPNWGLTNNTAWAVTGAGTTIGSVAGQIPPTI